MNISFKFHKDPSFRWGNMAKIYSAGVFAPPELSAQDSPWIGLRNFWKKSYKALILGWFQSGKPPFNFSFPYCSFVHFCFIINIVCCFVVIPFLLCLLQSLIFFIRKCFMFLFLLLLCSMLSCCYHGVLFSSCCLYAITLSC